MPLALGVRLDSYDVTTTFRRHGRCGSLVGHRDHRENGKEDAVMDTMNTPTGGVACQQFSFF